MPHSTQTAPTTKLVEKLRERIAELEAEKTSYQAGRRAALNLMEDAILAKRRADELNEQLRNEIAERERSERALRRSEEQFGTVAYLVPDLLWRSDPSGYTTWLNQRWLDYTGQTHEEAAGWG